MAPAAVPRDRGQLLKFWARRMDTFAGPNL
jgi:hypothetical protein